MSNQIRRIIFIGLLSLIFGCSQKKSELPKILSESEVEGFADMVFAITDAKKLPDGEQFLKIESVAGSQKVGLSLIFDFKGQDWNQGIFGVTFKRIGTESDALLIFMDSVYKTNIKPKMIADNIRLTGWTIEGDPSALESGIVKIKLFIGSEKEDEYAELYLNIDYHSKKAWIDEKDPEYRKNIIHDLMKN